MLLLFLIETAQDLGAVSIEIIIQCFLVHMLKAATGRSSFTALAGLQIVETYLFRQAHMKACT